MTRDQHRREAEELLELSRYQLNERYSDDQRREFLTRAHVHALLALSAPAEIRDDLYSRAG